MCLQELSQRKNSKTDSTRRDTSLRSRSASAAPRLIHQDKTPKVSFAHTRGNQITKPKTQASHPEKTDQEPLLPLLFLIKPATSNRTSAAQQQKKRLPLPRRRNKQTTKTGILIKIYFKTHFETKNYAPLRNCRRPSRALPKRNKPASVALAVLYSSRLTARMSFQRPTHS